MNKKSFKLLHEPKMASSKNLVTKDKSFHLSSNTRVDGFQTKELAN